jgi:zinc D-Ala-D-Ala carboxypeptidase
MKRPDASSAPGTVRRRPDRRLRVGGRRTPGTPRVLRELAIGLSLGAFLLGVPVTTPPTAALGPLPPCRLADFPTLPGDYDSYATTLVDWMLTVGPDYKPPDLVSTSEAGIGGGGLIRKVAIDDLAAMAKAARAADSPIAVWSPYRSYEQQVSLFSMYASAYGYANAITYSQRPGHSEHQLGLGVDFGSAGGGNPLPGDWGTTPAGKWMGLHAWEYGWVLSYPKGKGGSLWSDATCFHYEPWHYRYVGREVAAQIHASGLTIREYLWEHDTVVDPVTGLAIATATPTPSPSPTPSPTTAATPTALPTTAPSAAPSPTTRPAGGWLGLDPPVVIASVVLLVLLASLGFAARRRSSSG